MTQKVFWEDPYCPQINTIIIRIDGFHITVDKTILYPFSGGQERDYGTIADREVLEVHKRGKELIYTLGSIEGLSVGDSVLMKIDWERRYALMRLHFAAELVLETVYRSFPSIEKIGAHIGQDKARVDFLWAESLSPHLALIGEKVSRLINEDHEIISAFSDLENERRYWEVPGFARVACGGTHLKRTGEVGAVTLKRDNIGKGKERIDIYLNK